MEQRLQLADIAAGLVRRNNMPAKEAEVFVRQFFDCIADNLFHDNIVKVKELGTFKVVGVEARESVDINTGQRILIEEHTKVSFTPDSVLRDAINKPFAEFQTVVLNANTPIEAMEAFDVNDESSQIDLAETQDIEEPVLPERQPKMISEEHPIAQLSAVDLLPDEGQSAAVDAQLEEKQPAAELQLEEEQTLATDSPLEEEQSAEVEPQPQKEQPESSAAAAITTPVEQSAEMQPQHSSAETGTQVSPESPVKIPVSLESPAGTPASPAPPDGAFHSSESLESAIPRRRHGFWNVALPILLSILFFVMGYGIGYYRPVTMPDWQHLFASSKAEQGTQTATPKQSSQVGPGKTVKPSPLNNREGKVSPEAQNAKESIPKGTPSSQQTSAQPERKQPSEILAYPQVEDGEYHIVGIKGTEVMKPGKTLLNISIKYYKSKDFVNYICTMNNIKNPDVVPLGMELKIPELKRK